MKALALIGSRNPEGRTARSAGAVARGLHREGVSTTSHIITEMNIERCRMCDENGWGICRSEGRCVIEDDFAGVVDAIKEADAVIFATPVYFSDLSESMKALLDRLRRITRHESAKKAIDGKKAIGVCMAGGGGGGAPNCCLNMEKVLSTCGFDLLDIVPVRRQNFDLKLETLEITGRWLAGRIE